MHVPSDALDEKYNVRVSTRNYKGPELLTNDNVEPHLEC